MQVKDAIIQRRSIRKYSRKELKIEEIIKILEIARFAPSSGNLQNWKLIIISDRDKIKDISEFCIEQEWISQASYLIIICNERKKVVEYYGEHFGEVYSIQNCAIIAAYIELLALDRGLGSCWVGAYYEDKIKKLLDIPDEISIDAIITIGYQAERKLESNRKPLRDICFFNKFGIKISKKEDIFEKVRKEIGKRMPEIKK